MTQKGIQCFLPIMNDKGTLKAGRYSIFGSDSFFYEDDLPNHVRTKRIVDVHGKKRELEVLWLELKGGDSYFGLAEDLAT